MIPTRTPCSAASIAATPAARRADAGSFPLTPTPTTASQVVDISDSSDTIRATPPDAPSFAGASQPRRAAAGAVAPSAAGAGAAAVPSPDERRRAAGTAEGATQTSSE